MARAVAEIDGDSSGLVGALDQGKKGMEKLEAEGKKLSDQLREVTDSADKAAGALVQKIGGPKAITAIAGAGAAFGAAKMAADFFLNSVEKLFKSMGDDGMKVWADVEKALDSVSGAFAKAVLGGGSAEDMGKKLITVFEGLATIIEAVVKYGFPALTGAFDLAVIAMGTLNDLTKKTTEDFDALKRSQDTYAASASVTAIDNLTTAYGNLQTKVQGLVGDQSALALTANDQAIAETRAFMANAQRVGNIIKDVEIRKEVEKSRKVLMQRVENEVANIDFSYAGMGWKIERDREVAERFATASGELYSSIAKKFSAEHKDAYYFMPEALRESFELASGDLSKLEERGDELFERYMGRGPENKPKTGTAGPPKGVEAPPDPGAAMAAALAKVQGATAAGDAALDELKQKTMDFWGFSPPPDLIDTLVSGAKAIGGAALDAVGAYNELGEAVWKWNGEIVKSNATASEAHSDFYDKYVEQTAKMVGTAIGSGKTMAEIAQATIGTIISALGDEMFARASIATFSGNIPGAVGLTAAGMAAYATAAYLGSTAKKSGSATKATAKESSVVNQSTSYNLQIDAAFADEESIARAFSKAQRLANTRYLGSAAY